MITALATHFPNVEVYGEEIKQGLEEPCFFVKLFPVVQDREVGSRYKRYHSFDIHYFPQSETNEEMFEIAERLMEQLEYIPIGTGLCRGTKMEHEIISGVLHFKVDYDIHVRREKKTEPYMQTLKQKGGLPTWAKQRQTRQ